MPHVRILLPWNDHAWSGAHLRVPPATSANWRQDPRLNITDWTLAAAPLSDGHHYAPMVAGRKVERIPELVDVTFWSRPDDDRTRWAVVGGFREAVPLTGTQAKAAWELMRREGLLDRRVEEVQRSMPVAASRWLSDVVCRLRGPAPELIWKVRPADVVHLPMIALERDDYITTARLESFELFDGLAPWRDDAPEAGDDAADSHSGDGVEWEGIRQLEIHERFERTRLSSRIERIKRARLADRGRLGCDHCGYDFAETFGADAQTCIEGHHTRPLATLPDSGAAVSDDEIALLCPNCHRAAHRLGAYSLPELSRHMPDATLVDRDDALPSPSRQNAEATR